MQTLLLHPACLPGPIISISAGITATPSGCRATFRATGDLDAITIPESTEPVRQDDLWQTTCFEIFWQPEGGAYYREFNLSPSSRWACYDFEDFRKSRQDAPANVAIQSSLKGDALVLEVDIVSELPVPAEVALNAIIEDNHGNIQFWALAFPAGKPEFHSKICRAIHVEGPAV